mmetsp:Transcript_24119/g.69620  ORF Transcript_24119/g.69620 Transcript_24119/m.69620 type:complete len:294 (+) Transcript_24119:904-1785(+)
MKWCCLTAFSMISCIKISTCAGVSIPHAVSLSTRVANFSTVSLLRIARIRLATSASLTFSLCWRSTWTLLLCVTQELEDDGERRRCSESLASRSAGPLRGPSSQARLPLPRTDVRAPWPLLEPLLPAAVCRAAASAPSTMPAVQWTASSAPSSAAAPLHFRSSATPSGGGTDLATVEPGTAKSDWTPAGFLVGRRLIPIAGLRDGDLPLVAADAVIPLLSGETLPEHMSVSLVRSLAKAVPSSGPLSVSNGSLAATGVVAVRLLCWWIRSRRSSDSAMSLPSSVDSVATSALL